MERKMVMKTAMMMSLLLIGVLISSVNIQPVKASGTIYIRADGSIDPPTAPISTIDNVTYIFTDNIYDEIVVERDNITIDGMGKTVQGTGAADFIGIDLSSRVNVTVRNTTITTFFHGVYLYSSSNNSISGNNITNNSFGIRLWYSSNYNSINGNKVTNNGHTGIYLGFSSNNCIDGNNITNNRVDGIGLYNSSNISVRGNNITNNRDYGVYLYSSSNNSISGNNITNNSFGIRLWYSSSNSVSGNNITNNFGIGLWGGVGVILDYSSNYNRISENKVANNGLYGIYLGFSSNNRIHHNNFINNNVQVYSVESANIWDDGYPSGGNYWSDYVGIDLYSGPYQNVTGSDGIGDTPYTINEENRDNYPFIKWTPIPIHDVAVVSVVPSATEVYVGQVVNINVVVKNEGTVTERFPVTFSYKLEGIEYLIGAHTVSNLAPNTTTTFTFTWTTTDITVHTIMAEIPPLEGEIDTADNIMTSPITVKVKILGDVNNDNKVDIRDIAQAALAFGSYQDHPRWNPQADVNQDGKVDIKDIALIAKNFGKTYP